MTDGQHIEAFDGVTCAPDAMGELLGCKRESVARLAKVEGMPKAGHGRYPVRDCVNWALERERERAASHTPEDKKARMKVAQQQELRLKIENAEKLSELLPADIVASGFSAMASSLASELDGLAPRVAAQLAGMDEPSKVQKVLFDECRRIRDTAAAAFEAVAGVIDSGDDTETAAGQKRRAMG